MSQIVETPPHTPADEDEDEDEDDLSPSPHPSRYPEQQECPVCRISYYPCHQNIDAHCRIWHMSEIEPDLLFLGDSWSANNVFQLRHFRIGMIITVAHEIRVRPQIIDETKVEYHKFDWHDDARHGLIGDIPALCTLIQDRMNLNIPVLIHCAMGMSRSVSLVLAFYIVKRGMTYAQAYRWVKERRPSIAPNPAFVADLLRLEITYHRLGVGL